MRDEGWIVNAGDSSIIDRHYGWMLLQSKFVDREDLARKFGIRGPIALPPPPPYNGKV